jgi:hypothetical protein
MQVLMLLFSIVPQGGGMVVDRVDQIVLQDYWDLDNEDPKIIFSQFVFMDSYPKGSPKWGETYCVDWRLKKPNMGRPVYSYEQKMWVLIWTENEAIRCVTAPYFVEISDWQDFELLERERLPPERRRKLSSPKSLTDCQ